MTKAELRKTYKVQRQKLSDSDIEGLSLKIANQLLKMDIWDDSFYHIFLSIQTQKEVNTEYILTILSGKDKHVVLSKSNFATLNLSHFLLTDNTRIEKNQWDIPEPVDGISIQVEQIDVVFVPLLAFDDDGNRVGYGKGFYDKFLSSCSPETIKIGLSFFESEGTIEDISKTDIPLNYCVTPNKIYSF